MNNELVKIHNKKKNIIEEENESNQIIDSSDEKIVLSYFINNFKKIYMGLIKVFFFAKIAIELLLILIYLIF